MKQLKLGQRVYVQKDEDGEDIGIPGTVARLMMRSNGAWVKLDERHERCPFPADDATRAKNIATFPEYCTAHRAPAPAPAQGATP